MHCQNGGTGLPEVPAKNDVGGESLTGGMSWSISVPIFRNLVILKQLGLAIGIPFGLLAIIRAITLAKVSIPLWSSLIGALLFYPGFHYYRTLGKY